MGSKQQSDQPARKSNRQQRLDNVPTNIFTPRMYQVELLDKALQRNTIVCLNTEAGKSFILTLLVKELAHELDKHDGKRTFFLVDKARDVEQTAEGLSLHTALSVHAYTKQQERWNTETWIETIHRSQVFVMPAAIFLSLLEQDVVSMKDVNLLLLDDCHLARNPEHAYGQIMKHYPTEAPSFQPRVVGVTARVLNEECKTPQELEHSLALLESTLHSTPETSTDNLVADVYSAKPQEIIIDCDKYEDDTGLVEMFSSILRESIEFLDDVNMPFDEEAGETDPVAIPRTALMECQYVLDALGPWCCGKVAGVLGKQINKILWHNPDMEEWPRRFLQYISTQLFLIDHVMSSVFEKEILSIESFYRYMSPRVHKLIEILHSYKPDDNFMIISSEAGLDFPSSAIDPWAEPDQPEKNCEDEDDEQNSSMEFSDDEEFQEDFLPQKKANITEIDDKNNKQQHNSSVHYVAMRKSDDSDSVDGSSEPPEQPKDTSICGIVFLQRRHVAFILNRLLVELCNWDPDLFFIHSHTIIDKPGTKKRQRDSAQFKKQEEVLQKFRQKEYNLLIATSVLEEGVDVPRCNLIVRFDLPTDYRSYVQSKGRCRAPESKFYMLVDKPHKDEFLEELDTLRGFEKILLDKQEQQDSEEREVSAWDKASVDALLPAYSAPQADDDGASEPPVQLTMSSAIGMINKYCAKLPSDAFTHLTPKCSVEEKTENGATVFRAVLQLPVNSPLKKPVVGEWMTHRKFAKMAVALKACQKLYEEGELDKNFMPVGKERIRYEDEEHEWEETEATGQACPGTTKRKQYYVKRVAGALLGGPRADEACCLYRCHMTLRRAVTAEQNSRGCRIHAPEETPRHFGLITSTKMPLVPEFPVFTRAGEVTVCVELVSTRVTYTQEQLDRLYSFQRSLFSRVLRLEKDPMEFSPAGAESSYAVVPLTITGSDLSTVDIDWPFIDMLEKSPEKLSHCKSQSKKDKKESNTDKIDSNTNNKKDSSAGEASTDKSDNNIDKKATKTDNNNKKKEKNDLPLAKFEFRREDFEDAVVMPSYRNMDQPQYFYVAEIRTDLTPCSPFPSPELYDTFAAYYTAKYNLTITAPEQPLLDVDHTSARLNLLTPRYMNQKGVALPTTSAETRRARQESLQQKQILIPELCDIHPFPASLWRKAVCMPAILYRINYLLVAEGLRKLIAIKAHIGVADIDENFRFPELEFGFSTNPADNSVTSSESAENSAEGTTNTAAADKPCNGKDKEKELKASSVENAPAESIGTDNSGEERKAAKESSDSDEGIENRESDSSSIPSTENSLDEDSDLSEKAAIDQVSKPQDSNETGTNVIVSKTENSSTKNSSLGERRTQNATDSQGEKSDTFVKEMRDRKSSLENNTRKHLESAQTIRDNYSSCLEPGAENLDKHLIENVTESNNIPCQTADREDRSHLAPSSQQDVKVSTSKLGSECCDNRPNAGENGDRETGGKVDSVCKNSANGTQILPVEETDTAEEGNEDCNGVCKELPDGSQNGVEEPEVVSDPPDVEPLVTFDDEPDLTSFIGPSPCVILQTLSMSNANDFFNLERLETIGDSFLKFAITVYLYCHYPGIHEGKLSYLRSKQVSNYNLYKLGKKKQLPECMVAAKFEPTENWLPPGYRIKDEALRSLNVQLSKEEKNDDVGSRAAGKSKSKEDEFKQELEQATQMDEAESSSLKSLIPYNLQTQHSLPDKSIADCVEALIGCYLTVCGQRAALQFMSWIGLKVLPEFDTESLTDNGIDSSSCFGKLQLPDSPLLSHVPNASTVLKHYLHGFEAFEEKIHYRFRDRSYLLQAFTHASYHYNTVTDCYQRLEFLGDAILDYVITRHLFEDVKKHSPGILTDLRSALVNNNIFAALAVKWDFHKYFKAVSPQLFAVIEKFVNWQKDQGDEILLEEEMEVSGEEEEDKEEEKEDIEIPKALGDIFESVAGAIYLDSGMSLDTVWRVYYRMMKPQIDAFTEKIPKSPVRELLEMEPETAKFERPERTLRGKIRVSVTVVGKGTFKGVGRNYRIAKSAAAKRALKHIRLWLLERQRYTEMTVKAMSGDFQL